MFESFDRLMLMAKGQIIFYNEAKYAVDHFASIGYKCPEMSNPADYFMSIMSYETIEQELDERAEEDRDLTTQELYAKKIKYFSDEYQKSNLKNDPNRLQDGLAPLNSSDIMQSDASWLYQFGLLAKRNFTNIMRLPMTSYVKLIVTVLTAGFCVLLFNGVDKLNYQEGVQNRNGALFFITMTMAFNAIQNVILIFPDERPVFLREANNNMYSVSAYFWAKIISEFPSSLLTPVIFGSIVYFIIGLNDVFWYKFPLFLTIIFLIYNASSGYALIIGTLFSDKQLAVTLTPVLIIPFMLFAGFFVSQDNIPKFLIVFQDLSIFKYGYQALTQNEYKDLNLDCDGCDPFDFAERTNDFETSMLALAGMYAGFYLVALCIMISLSKKYE
uniref:Uncharacterized protein n=1 Tax=Strombidium rassoulzadegani TaxID=1082188 RepID=A0A7S3CN10_9SPIT|mmetsp:Transcript_17857/g.30311  ORF Transcript_17857/g.30311 Transcript_17857/m.30311 type:complete len:386 (+) Transcript_17857:731-1888(+)